VALSTADLSEAVTTEARISIRHDRGSK
jgi:hypothetical protein